MVEGVHLHFSYGSNMDVGAMRQRCANARPLGIARLDGWQYFVAISGYASLRRRASMTIHGVVWRLDDRDLAALDLYEDVANGLYRKARLTVEMAGRPVPALVYLTRDTRPGRPQPGYQEAVLAAATRWRLPCGSLRRLRAWVPPGQEG